MEISMERLLEKFGLYVGHLKDSTSSAKNSAARGTLQWKLKKTGGRQSSSSFCIFHRRFVWS